MAETKAVEFKPEDERKPKDMLCCVLFIIFNIAMIGLAFYAGIEGDYKKIVRGIDFRSCGCDTKSLVTGTGTNETCVKSSSGTELGRLSVFVEMYDTATFGKSLALVCADECPQGAGEYSVQVVCYPANEALVYPAGNSEAEQKASLVAAGWSTAKIDANCGVSYKASSIFGYCNPSANGTFIKSVDASINDSSWTSAINSIERAWVIIVVSLIVAVVLGFVYLWLLTHESFVKPLTYIAMLLVLVCLVVGGWALYSRSQDIKDDYTGENADGYKDDRNYLIAMTGAVLTFISAALYLCFIVFMWKRIKLALDCVIDAAEALSSAPFLVFLPLSFILVGFCIFVAWCTTAINLFSVGDVEAYDPDGEGPAPDGVLKRISINEDLRDAIIFHFFGLVWIIEFLSAVVTISIAIVATRWFFTPADHSGNKALPSAPVWTALKTTLKNHLGSAAFGSIIIAIITIVRAVLEYIDKKTKKAKKASKIICCIMCCCKCCLWCLEQFLRYLNKQAYIQIAITGASFWTAAKDAFNLLVSNVLRFGALSVVGTAFLCIGKLFVAGGATLIAYIVLTQVDRYSDSSKATAVAAPFFPCLLVFLGAWLVGSLFLSMMDVAMDAALQAAILGHAGQKLVGQMEAQNKKCADAGVEHLAGQGTMSSVPPSSQPQAGGQIRY